MLHCTALVESWHPLIFYDASGRGDWIASLEASLAVRLTLPGAEVGELKLGDVHTTSDPN